MNHISTHVLDTALGKPAMGVPVRLERLEPFGRLAAIGVGDNGSGRALRAVVAG